MPPSQARPRRNAGYVGIPTFMRSRYFDPADMPACDWAVIGAPYDEGSPFAPGARFGPRKIREHSLRFRNAGVFDSASRTPLLEGFVSGGRLVDVGDADILPAAPARSLSNLGEMVAEVCANGAKPLVIGGDHAITCPIVEALGEEVHVIQLDAHIDYMPFTEEFQFTNGQGFRKLHKLPNVQSLTQIGIRGLRNYGDDFAEAERQGSRIVHMPELRNAGPEAILAHVPAGAPVYVSIDIDAYDMSLIPGCVSGEPDGLTYADMVGVLTAISRRFNVRGFDLVEVNPMLDVATDTTSYLAAHTIVHFLGLIEANRAGSSS
jgi:agmatinase